MYFELDNDVMESSKPRSYHYHFFLRCNPLVNPHMHLNASHLISPNVCETDVNVTSHAANERAGAGFNLDHAQNQRNINRLGN